MKYFVVSFFLFSFSSLFSQNLENSDHLNCGNSLYTEAFFDAHPGQRASAEVAKASLDYFTRNYKESLQKDDNVLIIPVVFHIIHFNGTENISDEQVQSAIDVMNEDYSATNPGVGNVIPEFENIVANTKFEFRLAKKDPDGNCTNGIVRVLNSGTFSGSDALKQVSPTWGRSKYLNIWVCKFIGGGVAGYAYLPPDVIGSNGSQIDGILIQDDYVGRIGTGSPAYSHSLSHEVGHWANLEHPWGPTNDPALPGNCNVDDGVTDTPNTIGWLTCNLAGNTCNSLDNVQNFMDYSYCSEMFTQGQKTRMRAALNSSVSSRNNLWTASNLIATGVLEDDIVCHADFQIAGEQSVCADQEVAFEDHSFNGPDTWSWTFEGGTPATSSLENPVVTFSAPGPHTVSLTASNSGGSASVTRDGYITVLQPGENTLPAQEGFESFSSLPENDWFVINPDNSNVKWQLNSEAAYSGSKSVRVRGRVNTNGAVETLQSPTYDLTGISEDAVLQFKYAHALRSVISDDQMRIFISPNCGETWYSWQDIQIEDLPTVSGYYTSEFVPVSQQEWGEVNLDILNAFLTESFRFKIEFTSYAGNDLYIDNINISDPNSTGLDEVEFLSYVKVYPNPANTSFTVKYNMVRSGDVRISLHDVTGREVVQSVTAGKSSGEQTQKFDIQKLAPGIYFVQIQSQGEQAVRKLVVK